MNRPQPSRRIDWQGADARTGFRVNLFVGFPHAKRGEIQMANFRTAILGIVGAGAALSAITMAPALAQAVISEPGYCAFYYPNANCQNKGPGNPYTDPNYQRSQTAAAWQSDQTVGVAPRRRARKHAAAKHIY
jgi:hypothetical protein